MVSPTKTFRDPEMIGKSVATPVPERLKLSEKLFFAGDDKTTTSIAAFPSVMEIFVTCKSIGRDTRAFPEIFQRVCKLQAERTIKRMMVKILKFTYDLSA